MTKTFKPLLMSAEAYLPAGAFRHPLAPYNNNGRNQYTTITVTVMLDGPEEIMPECAALKVAMCNGDVIKELDAYGVPAYTFEYETEADESEAHGKRAAEKWFSRRFQKANYI